MAEKKNVYSMTLTFKNHDELVDIITKLNKVCLKKTNKITVSTAFAVMQAIKEYIK